MIVELIFTAAGTVATVGFGHIAARVYARSIERENDAAAMEGRRQEHSLPTPRFDPEAHWRALYAAVPSAFWLDPNLWGDAPKPPRRNRTSIRGEGSRDALMSPPAMPGDDYTDRMVKHGVMSPREAMRLRSLEDAVMPCPKCGEDAEATANHGNQASAWRCAPCDLDFTRADLKLPCGCPWPTPIHRVQGPGYSYSRCGQCHNWWEPPSNGDGRGRKLAQGERVWPPNETGALPRPRCPHCGRSHPELHTPINDKFVSFYRCTECRYKWDAPRDVDQACHRRY